MSDEDYMDLALEQARQAAHRTEVPIGCIIVFNNTVIASTSNRLEETQDPLAHAELLAISQAAKFLGSRRLIDCTMYVTLEPCAMCAGAIVTARIPRVVYAAADPKAGAVDTLYTITTDQRLNHRCTVTAGVRAEQSAELLRRFFVDLRQSKKSAADNV